MTDATVTINIDGLNEGSVELARYENELVKTATVLQNKGKKILEDLWPIFSLSLYRHGNYESFIDYCKHSRLNKAYTEAGCGDYFWDLVQVVNTVFLYVKKREFDHICPVTGKDMGMLVDDDGEVITAEYLMATPKILGKLIYITSRVRNEKKTFAERDSYVLATLGIVRAPLTDIVDEELTDEDGEPTEDAEDEYGLIPMSIRVNDDNTYTIRFDAIATNEATQIRRALKGLVEETIE